MQKINFQNLPNTTTPINATNLNAIQTNAETAINGVASDLSTLSTNLTNYVNGTNTMGNIKTTGLTTNGYTTLNGDVNILGNMIFRPDSLNGLDLDEVGTTYASSQEIALHNTGNIFHAPRNDEVAILKCYSWGGNPDWCVQEWFGLISGHKHIRFHGTNGWGNWINII